MMQQQQQDEGGPVAKPLVQTELDSADEQQKHLLTLLINLQPARLHPVFASIERATDASTASAATPQQEAEPPLAGAAPAPAGDHSEGLSGPSCEAHASAAAASTSEPAAAGTRPTRPKRSPANVPYSMRPTSRDRLDGSEFSKHEKHRLEFLAQLQRQSCLGYSDATELVALLWLRRRAAGCERTLMPQEAELFRLLRELQQLRRRGPLPPPQNKWLISLNKLQKLLNKRSRSSSEARQLDNCLVEMLQAPSAAREAAAVLALAEQTESAPESQASPTGCAAASSPNRSAGGGAAAADSNGAAAPNAPVTPAATSCTGRKDAAGASSSLRQEQHAPSRAAGMAGPRARARHWQGAAVHSLSAAMPATASATRAPRSTTAAHHATSHRGTVQPSRPARQPRRPALSVEPDLFYHSDYYP